VFLFLFIFVLMCEYVWFSVRMCELCVPAYVCVCEIVDAFGCVCVCVSE